VALDVGIDANYFKNPLLPLTRSEMALPLKINEHVIGVLDVQSTNPAAFSQDDITTIQTMADQLAVAINKARLLEQLENKTHELETAQRSASASEWQDFLARSRRSFGYRYRANRLQEVNDQPLEARQAFSERRMVIQAVPGERGGEVTSLAMPIIVREQVVGALNLRFSTSMVDQQTIRMIENIAGRLGLAIENARLMEENQRRAEREHKVSEITTKVRASSDIDRILRTAIEELGRTLGATQAVIQLKTEEPEAEVS
jgi:GAF domain-containing protein